MSKKQTPAITLRFPEKWLFYFFILEKQLASQKYVCRKIISYSCDCFSKIARTFYASSNSWIIIVFLRHTLKEKLPIFLINTLLLYIPLLALTDRQNHRETNTLASCGLEEPFFQLCCCVSFLFGQKIGFGFTYYYVLRVPYSCGVVLVFFVLAGNSFWCYVHT